MKELTTIGLLGLIATSVVLVGEIAPDHIDSVRSPRDLARDAQPCLIQPCASAPSELQPSCL